ncbi:TPA: ThiF family adenylyltransferase [Klebsiella michiganensis]|nr:ThiF family adenylyltransferase [Klebsiella michiganensis]ELS4625817.1 ThiF family adenylyltransferase [Klebsiella michiganensis]HCU0766825.1 ThiF family adenylyltransferase [Klebsiella michiganensis]HEP0440737.1 ThiF family adenylyltransferase [Klebsiella michiganensis]HEP0466822.1 ThiF family adenylyltransferase [Klebsiella michiganensis]
MADFFDIGKKYVGDKEAGASFLLKMLAAIHKNPFYDVVELKSVQNEEGLFNTIVVAVGDGTVPNNNLIGIKRTETLALIWHEERDFPLDVRALRKNFPITLHQNGVALGDPKSLCLFEHSWQDLQHKITPELILERILWWLRNAAEDTIHPDTQPIEQLFYSSSLRLIIPESVLIDIDKNSFITIVSPRGATPVIMRLINSASVAKRNIHHITILTKPIENSPVRYAPRNLEELDICFANENNSIKKDIIEWFKDNINDSGLKKEQGIASTMLLLIIPRIRGGAVERYDKLAFFSPMSLCDLGVKIGALLPSIDNENYYIDYFNDASAGHDKSFEVGLDPVSVIIELDKIKIRKISKIENLNCEFKGVLAGVGALGSHLAELWARQCWGEWTYLDNDIILPHNLVRHISLEQHMGKNKASVVSSYIDCIFGGNQKSSHLPFDVTSENNMVLDELTKSEIIVDATTSVFAPRTLSQRNIKARLASVFLTPSGDDSVLLLESKDKKINILSVENQYYRSIIESAIEGGWAIEHLKNNESQHYGLGCRSPSVSFSVDKVSLHSASISLCLKSKFYEQDAAIVVWRSLQNGSVDKISIPVQPSFELNLGEWTLIYDIALVMRLTSIRNEKLPLETGGAIFGMVDNNIKVITISYISDAPADSSHSHSCFIRGKDGMVDLLELIVERTGGMIDYIGEWHSHPKGYTSKPSSLDKALISNISSPLKAEGKPAIMLIAGESDMSVTFEGHTHTVEFQNFSKLC